MKEYKGCLKGFPDKVVNRMLDCQEEQGNKRDVSVFERSATSDCKAGGFDWGRTKEKGEFWWNVIHARFETFFEKYPKKENEYPKVMEVSDKPNFPKGCTDRRVVFMEKCGGFIAWHGAETIEESEKKISTTYWEYARDVQKVKVPEYTMDELFEKLGSKFTIKK